MNILREVLKLIFNENIQFSLFAFIMFMVLLTTPPLVFIPSILAVLFVDLIIRNLLNEGGR
jgi:hypothetical protein